MIKHKEQFNSLINDIKVRRKNCRQAITSDASSATDAMNQKNTKRDDTNSPTKTESIFIPDAPRETTVASEDYLVQEPVERNLTKAVPVAAEPCSIKTPQKSSRSTGETTFYQSPECKVIELLDKAVSAAIPVVEKLHEAFCKYDVSLSNCNMKHSPNKYVNEIERTSDYDENDFETSISVEQPSCQNLSLIPTRTSRAAATCTKDESKVHIIQRNQGQIRRNMEPHRDVTNKDSILILDSDEEPYQTSELGRGQWAQSTPMGDPVKNGTGRIESPSINSSPLSTKSIQQKDSILSATPISSSIGRAFNSHSRHSSIYASNIAVSAEEAGSSKRMGKNVKRNIMRSGRDRASSKSSEVSSKGTTRKPKQKRYKSHNITSFFYKVEEDKKAKVTKQVEDLQSGLSMSSSALFYTSSSGESDLELSVTKIDQSLERNVSNHGSKVDEVSCATPSPVHKTYIHSQLDNTDSDEEFLSRIRRSAKKVKAIESSSSSDEFVFRRSKRRTKSGGKFVDPDMAASPRTPYQSRTIEASSESTQCSRLSMSGTSFDSNESYMF